jgi:hypothetical protein
MSKHDESRRAFLVGAAVGAVAGTGLVGSSTFPTMSGFNPTLTIQALAYMSADAIANRYRKNPGSLL